MRPLDAESQVKAIVVQLDSETLLSRFREYERGGHRPASMSDGRGNSESPCPVAVTPDDETWESDPKPVDSIPFNRPNRTVLGVSDPTDREIRTDRLLYEGALRHMATAAQTAIGISNKYLIARTDDTTKAAKLGPPRGSGPCGNVWCDHICKGEKENDRLRKAPKQSGDDPAKAEVARCQACDQHWRRHRTERDARVREVKVKKAAPAAATVAARNFVAQHPAASPFVAALARKLDADPGWLPSGDQTELLLEVERTLVTSNQRKGKAS